VSAVYQLIIVALNEGYDTISLTGKYVTIGFIYIVLPTHGPKFPWNKR